MRIILILLICQLVFACSKKKTGVVIPKPVEQNFFVHGDPASLIKGARLNQVSFFTEENIPSFSNFYYMGLMQFIEKTDIAEVENLEPTWDDIEEENMADDEDQTNIQVQGSDVTMINQDEAILALACEGPGCVTNISLKRDRYDQEIFNVESIEIYGMKLKLKILHYSFSNDKKSFSILAEGYNDVDGKYLMAFYAGDSTKPTTPIKKVDEKFKYLSGAGVAIGWDKKKPLEVGYCGTSSLDKEGLVNESLEIWQDALTNRLDLEIKHKSNYPPFSDLNSNCIYYSNSYLSGETENSLNAGIAIPIINNVSGKLITSPVYIFRGFQKKYDNEDGLNDEFFRESEKETLTHEIGHFLGLDHKGLGKADDTKSIMSYSQGENKLEDYDLEAIDHLYPLP
jgi:hypothetical protein